VNAEGVGGSGYHTPVMLAESLDALNLAPGKRIVDATLGGGGHSREIAVRIAPGGILFGLDQDPEAIAEAEQSLKGISGNVAVYLHQTNFEGIVDALAANGVETVDGVLFDLGVSSHQLDTAGRGFAIRYQGPLDMRMNPSGDDETAADLLNRLSEAEIARILFKYGEEQRSRRIAAEIVRRRQTKPLETTEDLVDCIRGAMPLRTRPGEIHPATKTFQAVRIAVNRELDVLETALRAAVKSLSAGGRLVVISYHSLEDRIAKNIIAELAGKRIETDLPDPTPRAEPILNILTKKPLTPTEDEIRRNPRARSAKMRIAERR
jgi:16S rRNA (cytosine1402-N4)-methyltransferase